MKKSTLANIAAIACIPAIALTGMTTAALAQGDGDLERVVFEKTSGTHPTNGIDTLVIRGDACLNTEDSTDLRLVEYAPSQGKIVYRCTTP